MNDEQAARALKRIAAILRQARCPKHVLEDASQEAVLLLLQGNQAFADTWQGALWASWKAMRALLRQDERYERACEAAPATEAPATLHLAEIRDTICHLMSQCSEREQVILQGRAEGKSRQEIADDIGISRERVRQIFNEVTDRLRRYYDV